MSVNILFKNHYMLIVMNNHDKMYCHRKF